MLQVNPFVKYPALFAVANHFQVFYFFVSPIISAPKLNVYFFNVFKCCFVHPLFYPNLGCVSYVHYQDVSLPEFEKIKAS